MLERLKNIIAGKGTPTRDESKQFRREAFKLQESSSLRTVAMYEEAKNNEIDECAKECESCSGIGFLRKQILLIYPCKECNGEGKTYWIDRMLTAQKVNAYQEEYHKRVRNNIHTLMYEIKQEAMKIGAIAHIQLEPADVENERRKAKEIILKHLNIFGDGGHELNDPD